MREKMSCNFSFKEWFPRRAAPELVILIAVIIFAFFYKQEIVSWAKAVSPDEFNKVVLGVVAVVSVILSPLIQWRVARRQAADNISAKRQVWIDELRKEAAEVLYSFDQIENLKVQACFLRPGEKNKNLEDLLAASARSSELAIRIRLRLNPNEDDHNELLKLFTILNTIHSKEDAHSKDFYAAREAIIQQFQKILKREWERVKSGDM